MTHNCSGLEETFLACDRVIDQAGPEGNATATAIAANAFSSHVANRLHVLANYLENVCFESPAEFNNPAHTFNQLADLDAALGKLETAAFAVGHGRG